MLGNGLMLGCKLDGNPVGERSASSTTPGLVVGEKDSIGASVVPGLVSATVGEFVSDIGAMTGLLVIEGAVSDGPIAPPGFPTAYRNKDKSDSLDNAMKWYTRDLRGTSTHQTGRSIAL